MTEREPTEQPDADGSSDTSSMQKDQTTPGDAAGVPVSSEDAAEGTSEEFTAIDGILTYPTESEPLGDRAGDESAS